MRRLLLESVLGLTFASSAVAAQEMTRLPSSMYTNHRNNSRPSEVVRPCFIGSPTSSVLDEGDDVPDGSDHRVSVWVELGVPGRGAEVQHQAKVLRLGLAGAREE
jgi:hypothetical protein